MAGITLHVDGGARKNPGPAAIGIVVFDETGNELEQYCECIGVTTNNVAEYSALIKGLQIAAKHTRQEIQVFMDSELVVNQLNGTYRIKANNMYELFQQVKQRESAFKKVTYNWIPRTNKRQTRADELVNIALDGK